MARDEVQLAIQWTGEKVFLIYSTVDSSEDFKPLPLEPTRSESKLKSVNFCIDDIASAFPGSRALLGISEVQQCIPDALEKAVDLLRKYMSPKEEQIRTLYDNING